MKYTITGSTGHISKPLSELLIKAGHDVAIISSNKEKIKEIEALGAKALIGSIEDLSFLIKAFEGADAIYTIIPPKLDAISWKEFIYNVGDNYTKAIENSSVEKVVNLSSIGAHIPEGGGLVSLYYYVEQKLNRLAGVDVMHLRPGSFYTNFIGNIGMIKYMGIIGNNYENLVLPMVHPNDIAMAAFEELSMLGFKGKHIRYVVGDERKTDDIAKVLGKAIGKPDLKWVRFSDDDALNGMLQAGLTKDVAENLVKLGQVVASGESISEYRKSKSALSPIKLEDFAKDFAVAFQNS
jgi:uncharacterized protein YbjT (DUF2867 family)